MKASAERSPARPRIVIADDFVGLFADLPELAGLREVGEVVRHAERPADERALAGRLGGAAAVITVRAAFTRFSAELLGSLPDLRLIAVAGTGTQDVDVGAATRLGVAVTNAAGASARSVAETTIGLVLALAHHIARLDRAVRAGEWPQPLGCDVEGRTLGLVGLGRIAEMVARVARGLDMRVIAWTRRDAAARAAACGAEAVPLERLWREADIVSNHLRLVPETQGFIGRAAFATMRPTAFLVDTTRGGIVDEAALVDALRRGAIAGAALDVFAREPLPPDSPLRTLDDVILTPHAAWLTHETSRRMAVTSIDNVRAFFDGRPANLVNPEVLAAAASRTP
jgi:phosphoglycerate dehydrogenase-like enzyme